MLINHVTLGVEEVSGQERVQTQGVVSRITDA
jgi:hypothetical protein